MTDPCTLPPSSHSLVLPTYYRTYNQALQEQFGCRVYKVSLDGGFTCPNMDGTKGVGGCTFCDETGSSSRTNPKKTSIKEQLLSNIEHGLRLKNSSLIFSRIPTRIVELNVFKNFMMKPSTPTLMWLAWLSLPVLIVLMSRSWI
jgi:hypothetical protein